MKERFINWATSKQGIITIVITIVIVLLLSAMIIFGVWEALWAVIYYPASFFIYLFYVVAFGFFIPVWICMGVYKIFKWVKNKIKSRFFKPRAKTTETA